MPQFLVLPDDLDLEGGRAILRGEEAHHLVAVFRGRPGDRVLLFDGTGNRWSARLCEAGARAARLDGLLTVPSNEPGVDITLLQSVPKGERWEWILEKATELGVTRIVPVRSRFSVAVFSGGQSAAKAQRWRGIATSAAKQCERGRVPKIDSPIDLSEVLSSLSRPEPGEMRIVLAERLDEVVELPAGEVRRVVLAVGPEGGWAADELESFGRVGFSPLGLGPRTLRSETAALAGIVALQQRWGDLARVRPSC